jgi:hypothetical protein
MIRPEELDFGWTSYEIVRRLLTICSETDIVPPNKMDKPLYFSNIECFHSCRILITAMIIRKTKRVAGYENIMAA